MAMFVAENEEQLMELFKKMAQQIQPQQPEKDERMYLPVKDFAKDTGITESFLREHILWNPYFKQYVSQLDRKIFIKRREGRQALEKIMDEYRR